MESDKEIYIGQADASRHWEQRLSPASEYFELLRSLDETPEGKSLLDVGCAAGIEAEEFQKMGLLVDGVDINEDLIKEAQERLPESHFVVASAEALPQKDESYDIVFSINALFYTELEKSIAEFCRVLKPGGRGIISFDTEIINLDEGAVFHSDSVDHLEKVLTDAGAEIEKVGLEEQRIDMEPFEHQHTFHKIVFKKVGK